MSYDITDGHRHIKFITPLFLRRELKMGMLQKLLPNVINVDTENKITIHND